MIDKMRAELERSAKEKLKDLMRQIATLEATCATLGQEHGYTKRLDSKIWADLVDERIEVEKAYAAFEAAKDALLAFDDKWENFEEGLTW